MTNEYSPFIMRLVIKVIIMSLVIYLSTKDLNFDVIGGDAVHF